MSHIASFRKSFKIDKGANLKEVAVAVDAIYSAQHFAFERLGDIDPAVQSDGFRIHSLLNLLSRTFEHAQAMLVALATGSPTSAEALGRVVIEGSVNISCLALRGDAGTLIRFFRVWLGEHERKLVAWKEKMPTSEGEMNVPAMIDARREVVQGMENYLAGLEVQCDINTGASPEWPKTLLQRFQAIGKETDYYESYHRLSGSSHLTGEDTLTSLMMLDLPGDLQRQVALEAWAYSTMMTRIASVFFVEAAAACCVAYDIPSDGEIPKHRSALAKGVQEIAVKAGVPLDAGKS